MSDFLTAFKQFGVSFNGNNADDYYADCPFSGKENKFFVNQKTGLWDSKNTGKSGNLVSFCRQFYDAMYSMTEAMDLKPLAGKKQLPAWILKGTVVYNPLNDSYCIPYRNARGEVTNIGHYNLDSKAIIPTKTLKKFLLGLDKMVENDDNIVFITEGEWDYFALQWLLKRNVLKHSVIALPGASNFKNEWSDYFKDREVYVCMDKDKAGRQSADKLQKMLHLITVKMKYINWPRDLPEKYDVRDYIIGVCGDLTSFRTKHKACYSMLKALMHVDTPTEIESGTSSIHGQESEDTSGIDIPTVKEIEDVFRKWFEMPEDDMSIDVMLGTCFANKIKGDPVWLYLVGAPGTRKTAMLMSLNKSKYVETVSTLTPAALVSGMRAVGSEDPSLIPKLNNRMLIIKDVTTLLSGATFVRDEIFGMLRDAFDGYVEKVFGTGLKKSFKSKFGVIGAVTPVIDGYQSHQAILGERFLKFRLESEMETTSEYDVIMQTLANIANEEEMNNEMQDIVYRMLLKPIPEEKITFESGDIRNKIIYMGVFVAKMRGSLNLNPYTREQLSKPITEIGTRVTKELSKLAMGICILHDHGSIGTYELERCRKVAVDTCPDRVEMIVRLMYGRKEAVCTQDIINFTMLSSATISVVLNSLVSLKIIKRLSGYERAKCTYMLTDNLLMIIEKSCVYANADNVKPVSAIRLGQQIKEVSPVEPEKPHGSIVIKRKKSILS